MCTVCGCDSDESAEKKATKKTIHFGDNEAATTVAGLTPSKTLEIEKNIMAHNDGHARKNRRRFAEQGICALNIMSSPGAGKTTLLVSTLQQIKSQIPCWVIEGDQQSEEDADAIAATSVEVVQVNTGKGCHLDAHMLEHGLEKLSILTDGLLFIENVGNLVCPAGFDLGENLKIVLFSVTEGANKPKKYPYMFAAADLVIFTKLDLLPYVDFDVESAKAYILAINPNCEFFEVSTLSGEGMPQWLNYLTRTYQADEQLAETRV